MKKAILLFISLFLIAAFYSCVEPDNNSSGSSEASDNLSENDESTMESSFEKSENEVSVSSEDSSKTNLSINDIEDIEHLGLTKEDERYLLIKAFLNGDTAVMEEKGCLEKGVLDDYKTLKIGAYTIYPRDDYTVIFSFDIIESGLDTMPVGEHTVLVESPYDTYFTTYNKIYDEASAAQYALFEWDVFYKICDYSDPASLTGEQKEDYISSLTEYVLWSKSEFTLDEFQEYAYKISGLKDIIPSDDYLCDGLYSVHRCGGIMYSYEVIDEKTENGITTVTIQFYADWAETIKSHVIEYKLKQIDEDLIFLSSDYVYESDHEPLIY